MGTTMVRNTWRDPKRWPVEVPDLPLDNGGNIPVWFQGKWIVVASDDLGTPPRGDSDVD